MGLTAKFAVAVFGVLLGYFATAKLSDAQAAFGRYVVQRYLQFVVPMFIVNLLVVLGNARQAGLYGFRQVLVDSFFFSDRIVPTFWCMGPFFIASALIGLIAGLTRGNRGARLGWYVASLIVCLLAGKTWVGVCVMGAVLHEVLQAEVRWMRSAPALLAMAVCAFVLARVRAENELMYLRYGAACFLLLAVFFSAPRLQRLLDVGILGWLGSISFHLYLVHVPVQYTFTNLLVVFLAKTVPTGATLAIAAVATLLADIAAAYLLGKTVEQVLKVVPGEQAAVIRGKRPGAGPGTGNG